MLISNQSLLAKSHEQNCLFLMIICVKADYEQQFRLLFSRHNVLQISEPDYLCLRLNKEFSSVFHLMRCQSRSLWCYNYYGNKKVKNSQKNATWSKCYLILSQCHFVYNLSEYFT